MFVNKLRLDDDVDQRLDQRVAFRFVNAGVQVQILLADVRQCPYLCPLKLHIRYRDIGASVILHPFE